MINWMVSSIKDVFDELVSRLDYHRTSRALVLRFRLRARVEDLLDVQVVVVPISRSTKYPHE